MTEKIVNEIIDRYKVALLNMLRLSKLQEDIKIEKQKAQKEFLLAKEELRDIKYE